MRQCLGFFVVAFLGLAACTDHPSGEEVVDRSVPVICAKTQECSGALFELAYPGGLSACESSTKEKVKASRDLDGDSVCTDDELNKCLDQFKAAACKEDGSIPDVPCKC